MANQAMAHYIAQRLAVQPQLGDGLVTLEPSHIACNHSVAITKGIELFSDVFSCIRPLFDDRQLTGVVCSATQRPALDSSAANAE
jgi:hypothetical protein